jgi:hypothetical protein
LFMRCARRDVHTIKVYEEPIARCPC